MWLVRTCFFSHFLCIIGVFIHMALVYCKHLVHGRVVFQDLLSQLVNCYTNVWSVSHWVIVFSVFLLSCYMHVRGQIMITLSLLLCIGFFGRLYCIWAMHTIYISTVTYTTTTILATCNFTNLWPYVYELHIVCVLMTAIRDSFRGWEYGDLSSLRSIPLSSILNYTSSRVILKYWGVRTISPTWRSSNCIMMHMCTLQPLQAKDWGSASLSPLCGLHATWWDGGAEQGVSEEDAQCGQIITKAQRTSVW